MDNIKPINGKFIVRQCQRGVTGEDGVTRFIGSIAIPDSSADYTWYAEIISVADDCVHISSKDVGKFVYLCGRKPGIIHQIDDELFSVNEKIFTERTPKRGHDDPFDLGFAALIGT